MRRVCRLKPYCSSSTYYVFGKYTVHGSKKLRYGLIYRICRRFARLRCAVSGVWSDTIVSRMTQGVINHKIHSCTASAGERRGNESGAVRCGTGGRPRGAHGGLCMRRYCTCRSTVELRGAHTRRTSFLTGSWAPRCGLRRGLRAATRGEAQPRRRLGALVVRGRVWGEGHEGGLLPPVGTG